MNITLYNLLQRIRQQVLAINCANSGFFRGKKSTLIEMLSKLFRRVYVVLACSCRFVPTESPQKKYSILNVQFSMFNRNAVDATFWPF